MTAASRAEQLARLRRPADPRPEVARVSSRRAAAFDSHTRNADWYHVGPVAAVTSAEPGDDQQTEATAADVYVFDTIGGWFGVTADDFVRDVASLDVDQLVLHLNSPGGDVFEGIAIANVLRAHRAKVTVRVDGVAASACSVVAMAGDEVIMGIGASMMVHDAWGGCIGDTADMEKYARRLSSASDSMAATYAAKAGGTTAEWRDVMRAETWYTAEEAVAAGLADRVAAADETGTAEGDQVIPGLSSGFWDMWGSLSDQGRFDLSAYRYAGRDNAPAPGMPGRSTPAPNGGGPTTEQEGSPAVAFSDEQLTTLRQKLGTAENADEATILAALDERLAERTAAPATVPEGHVVVSQNVIEEMRIAAQDGQAARAQQLREERDNTIKAAITAGRISPARRDHWAQAWDKDPAGAKADLASLPEDRIPVSEIGYGKDEPTDPAAVDDYWFAGVGGPSKTEG